MNQKLPPLSNSRQNYSTEGDVRTFRRWERAWLFVLIILAAQLVLPPIHAQQQDEPDGADEKQLLVRSATAFCDTRALGRRGDQLFISATIWLDCMVEERLCQYDGTRATPDLRDAIVGCQPEIARLDPKAEMERFWALHRALQAKCNTDLGGPCGYSSQLLTDAEIEALAFGDRATPDPLVPQP